MVKNGEQASSLKGEALINLDKKDSIVSLYMRNYEVDSRALPACNDFGSHRFSIDTISNLSGSDGVKQIRANTRAVENLNRATF